MSSDLDTLYRVSIQPDTNTVQVSCIGIDRVDNKLEGTYLSVEDLPEWVQGRIALLMMVDPKPPTSQIEDVGQRIDRYTVWICGKEGWELNYCVALYNEYEDSYSWSLEEYGYPTGGCVGSNVVTFPNKPWEC